MLVTRSNERSNNCMVIVIGDKVAQGKISRIFHGYITPQENVSGRNCACGNPPLLTPGAKVR